jgi:hypothetical protein
MRHDAASPFPSMLETIAIVLVVLWLLGLVSSYTLGGFIHLLLLLAFIVIILRLLRGRNPLG